MSALLALVMGAVMAGGAGVDPDVAEAPACPPAVEPAAEVSDVGGLLAALESADRGIETLQGMLIYDRVFKLEGDQHIRTGTLAFESKAAEAGGAPQRRFDVRFDTLQIGSTVRDEDMQLIFDGRWLIEKDPENRQIIKREIAPPGAGFDPMRLGESPVPLPIGQKKADIEANFEAEMLGAAEGLDPEFEQVYIDHVRSGAGSYQLRLTPREGTSAAESFREIRLWYAKGTMHPRLAKTMNRKGDVAFVQLAGVRVNEPLAGGAFEVPTGSDGEEWPVNIIEGRFDEADFPAPAGVGEGSAGGGDGVRPGESAE